MWASLWVGALAALFAAVYTDPRYAAIYLVALAWVWINLRLWEFSLKEFFSRRRLVPMVFLGSAKAVWLILVLVPAYWAQIGIPANFAAFFLGLATPLLVLLLKSLGRMLTKPTLVDITQEPDNTRRQTNDTD